MKTTLLSLIILIPLFSSKAKLNSIKGIDNCVIFPQKGKPIDTVNIEAYFTVAEEMPFNDPIFSYFEKQKNLYIRKCCFSIEFYTDNCNVIQQAICSDRSKDIPAIITGKKPLKVMLTCVIFRDNKIPTRINVLFC